MLFDSQFQVRDYECDMQGIVNNAVYQNYFEHARHLYLLRQGLSFHEMTKNGIFVVVYRAEIDYLSPLKSQDTFQVSVGFKRLSRATGLFEQEICVHDELRTRGKFYIAATNAKSKPINLDQIEVHKLIT